MNKLQFSQIFRGSISPLLVCMALLCLIHFLVGCEKESAPQASVPAETQAVTPAPVNESTAAESTSEPVPEPKPEPKPKPKPKPQPVPVTGPPAITFESIEHDFGTISDAEEHYCSFNFTNTGGSLLNILRVTSHCSCADTTITKWNYAPGESGTINTTYVPKSAGWQRQTITVLTNAPESRTVELAIKATGQQFLATTLRAKLLKFGDVARHRSHTKVFEVWCRDKNMTVTDIHCTDERIATELVSLDSEQGKATVRATLPDDMPWGPLSLTRIHFTAAGHLENGRAVEKTLKFIVVANVVDDIRSEPTRLSTGILNPNQNFRSSVTLTHLAGQPFEITDVHIVDPETATMTVDVQPNQDFQGGYVITLSGTAGTQRGAFLKGSVQFTISGLGDPLDGVRNIPISGMIRKPQ